MNRLDLFEGSLEVSAMALASQTTYAIGIAESVALAVKSLENAPETSKPVTALTT
jgi:hypothetical protein